MLPKVYTLSLAPSSDDDICYPFHLLHTSTLILEESIEFRKEISDVHGDTTKMPV